MNPERWAQVKRLHHEALGRPIGERPAFLAQACEGDADLRAAVESLLEQNSEDGFLSVLAAQLAVAAGDRSLIGRRLGAYRVEALLGAGGMGEVYRARDPKLGRDVAIKILPRAFTDNPDRLARFEREARMLAALNHPNIGAIYGFEEGDVRALVLELVEGETLAERVRRGPIPVAQALLLAAQIAAALDAAHEKGIVHRDLKPANIKIAPDGVVKVLDFGLAKLQERGSDDSNTESPTVTIDRTHEGAILGTAAYMSPEQARGSAVDKRTDIWAFGCILYEMLVGRAAFARDSMIDTLAAVVDHEPDWHALPSEVPGRLHELLHRCLQKDAKRRLRDAGDAFNEIVEKLNVPSNSTAAISPAARHASPHRLVAAAAGALMLGAVVTGTSLWIVKPWDPPTPAHMVQFIATSGNAQALQPSGLDRDIAISPDGTRLVYVAGGPGRIQLVTRPLSGLDTALLSEGGAPRAPFFSPDGLWVGFFETFGAVKRISASGGPVTEVCRSVGGAARGASWSADAEIFFATTDPGTGLWRVPAAGGTPELLTRPDTSKGELDHFWPEVLPGGRAVLFTIASAGSIDSAQIAVLDLGTRTWKVLIRGGTHAQYVPTGHLVYGAEGSLHAVPFNLERLEVTGNAVNVLEPVAITPEGAVNVAVSSAGTLAYVRADNARAARMLVWVDREGREDPIAAPPRPYVYPRLSPDGTRVAIEVWDENRDIWVWDVARETLTRLTENPGRDGFPVWTPDGRRLIFGSARNASTNLFWRAADGTGSVDRLTESRKIQFPYSVSPDGTRLIIREDDPETGLDISVVPLKRASEATALIRTAFNEQNAEVSPDGHWLAYQANDSGQDEIYVRPFPNAGEGRWQVSTAGGTRPLWATSGRELFYLAPNGLNSVTIMTNRGFQAGRPRRLIEHRYFAETAFIGRTYDVSRDGQRFLMIKEPGSATSPQIVVVQNWTEELNRLVPMN